VKRLLLDEHIPQLFRVQLSRQDPAPTVSQIGDEGTPKKGTLDPELLEWCEANDFLLVTNNRATMPVHLADHLAAGMHVPGILCLDLGAPIGLIIEYLWLLALASREDEFSGTITHIPPK
jgi:uncharacterized protein DUF5615